MSAMNVLAMPKSKPVRKPRSRVRGQGTLFLRGPIFWGELNWHGERFRKSMETSDRESALLKLDAWIASIRAGELPQTFEPITVQTMFEAFLLRAETDCSPRTQEDYRGRWNGHLKTPFGSMVATAVNKEKITQYLHARKNEGATLCTRNREQRVLMMVFGHNKSRIPADRFPEFPKMQSERAHVRHGRLSKEDFDQLQTRLEDPKEFWLKVYLTLTFKYGFRKSELLRATCGYFDAKNSTFTLPAFTTKNKLARVVDLLPGGDIHKMLVQLVAGRPANAPLFTRGGKVVKDFRGAWDKLVEGIKGGSGPNGEVWIHDLRRSAITAMNEKGISASQAGTHLSPDVFARYVSRNLTERRKTARLIEGD